VSSPAHLWVSEPGGHAKDVEDVRSVSHSPATCRTGSTATLAIGVVPYCRSADISPSSEPSGQT
jgi:hypothetical protein